MSDQQRELRVSGSFETPTQSEPSPSITFNDLLIKGLSATVGLRLDYEKIRKDYNPQQPLPTLISSKSIKPACPSPSNREISAATMECRQLVK
jgi:hypothetical protein